MLNHNNVSHHTTKAFTVLFHEENKTQIDGHERQYVLLVLRVGIVQNTKIEDANINYV